LVEREKIRTQRLKEEGELKQKIDQLQEEINPLAHLKAEEKELLDKIAKLEQIDIELGYAHRDKIAKQQKSFEN